MNICLHSTCRDPAATEGAVRLTDQPDSPRRPQVETIPMTDSFSRWRASSRAAAESPNAVAGRPWLLCDHPATCRVLDDYPDLFRQFTMRDWRELEREFWRRFPWSAAATDELLVLVACRIARARYGHGVGG